MSERPIKQVIVIRKDLKMRQGKACSQAAHASMKVLLDLGHRPNKTSGHWEGETFHPHQANYYVIPLREEIEPWVTGNFRKIVLGVESEAEMLDILDKARLHGLHHALITDNGLTEFNGVPTNTAIAIGPNYDERINPITGHLKPL